MSGYRVMAGMGRLNRGSTNGPDSMGTASKVFDSTATVTDTKDCLHQLTERIGVGMTLSISRTRNMNYAPEIGMREFAIGTPGMYDVEFTMDGIFAPSVCDSWLKYVFMQGSDNDPVEYEVTASNQLVVYTDATYSTKANTPDDKVMYYVQIGTSGAKFGKKMLGADIKSYNAFATGSKVVKLFGYTNLQGPKYFDIGYQKINAHASGVSQYDGKNEFGCLCGCIINSASITYDSGSDAAIRFSISGSALCDYTQVSTDSFDYSSILSALPTDVFVGGCMSVFNGSKYNAVAQTDSASVSISNNPTKLGNCNRLTYSSYAMAGLTYDVSTSTYSNDPEKYLKYLYGYNTLDVSKNYHVGRQAVPIGNMKIRTDDTSATTTMSTMFMDINMNNVYVGDMNYNFSVDSPIMDEPSLRAQTLYMAVGYSKTGISATDVTESGGSSSSESGGTSDSGATGK